MKRKLATIAILAACSPVAFAFPITAYYTGQSEQITTVSGQYGVRCEYRVETMQGERYFTEVFAETMSCPYTVEVQ
jgi:hypothetical protein